MAIRTKIISASGYQDSKGNFFKTFDEAKHSEFKIQLEKLTEEIGIGCGGEWSSAMIDDAIIEYKLKFKEVFEILDEQPAAEACK